MEDAPVQEIPNPLKGTQVVESYHYDVFLRLRGITIRNEDGTTEYISVKKDENDAWLVVE